MDKEKRFKSFERIESLFDNNCRVCPAKDEEHTRNSLCSICPIIPLLQAEGEALGGTGKQNKISEEQFKIADRNNIKRVTVKSRVWNWGWDVERAITEPINLKRKKGS